MTRKCTKQTTIQLKCFKLLHTLKAKLSAIYVKYAKYLFRNKLQTNSDHTTARRIEDLLRMSLFSVKASESKVEAYHLLAMIKMQTLDNENESAKFGQEMQIYDQ